MKKIATIEVFQFNTEDLTNYMVVLTVEVETPFGSQKFACRHAVNGITPGKSPEGKYDQFKRVVRNGVDECLKRLRVNILSRGEKDLSSNENKS